MNIAFAYFGCGIFLTSSIDAITDGVKGGNMDTAKNSNNTASKTSTKKKGKLTKRRKRKNLCIREDVMNKNVLRALKRELINLYEEFNSTHSEQNKYRERVKEFCDHLVMTSDFDPYQDKNFNKETFYTYVCILINY